MAAGRQDRFFLDKPPVSGRVMLKVVPVHLRYEDRTLDTFALLDDRSERTILLSAAVEALGIQGDPEDLPLRTVRDDVQVIHGCSIAFQISSVYRPQISYQISHAFTADRLNLSRQSYPVEQLRWKYRHLRGLPIRTLTEVQALLLIGSDQPHLITPTEPVRWGGPGAPVAVRTRLGWTVQGPVPSAGCPSTPCQCMFTSSVPVQDEVLHHVQRLWQLDTVPYRECKEVTRSKQDQEALQLLDRKTLTLEIEGVRRLATPLLQHKDMPLLNATRDSALPNLRSVERRLLKDPEKAETYQAEMSRLLETGAVCVLPDPVPDTSECWYIPHHILSHNGKSRLVFNCSHQYRGQSLNQYLLPRPTCWKTVKPSSRLVALAPEMDPSNGLIRVGGRLRRVADLVDSVVHPVVLDSKHPVTRLIIHHYDNQLHHPGSERLFAEIRRHYWIQRGHEAVRRFQLNCLECRRWRGQPSVPQMSDLPSARLQLYKPAFHSCGMDCFGPFIIKIGRRTEKRWGVLFKCFTTRAVHLDLLPSLSTDSFLMALRRFIARRGTPAQLWSDRGTNFRGGERELREAYAALAPDLQRHLARQKISFCFNPPSAPHFGGVWEREVRSVKSALYTVLGSQSVPEEVLMKVEAILNSKPLGYVSSDVADADPVTPSSLLMGWPDGSLPQVIYSESEILSRIKWRYSQILADRFWSRFIRDYLPSLQTRQKWQASPPDL